MRQFYTAVIDKLIGYQDRYGDNYPIDYGYIPNLIRGDGEWQNVYIIPENVSAPLEVFEGELVAIIHRTDDMEARWILATVGKTATYDRIEQAAHFLGQYFTPIIKLL